MKIINQEFEKTEAEFQNLTDGQVFLISRGTGRDVYMKLESQVSNEDGEYNSVLLNNGELYFIEPDKVVYVQESTLIIKHEMHEIE